MCWVGDDVADLVRVIGEDVEFLTRAFFPCLAQDRSETILEAVLDEPGLRRGGVDVGEGGAGVIQRLGFGHRIAGDGLGIAHGPAVGLEIFHIEKIRCAQGADGIGHVILAPAAYVDFAPDQRIAA